MRTAENILTQATAELSKKETAALLEFVSRDTTRAQMCHIWTYVSDGGRTDVATDGHTIAVRREGTHLTIAPYEIEKLPTLQSQVEAKPMRWSTVLSAPQAEGKNVPWRGINPAYFARVATVEAAETKRRAEVLRPEPRESAKSFRRRKAQLSACSKWCIGCQPLDGWYWEISDDPRVRWEGVIMPRRV